MEIDNSKEKLPAQQQITVAGRPDLPTLYIDSFIFSKRKNDNNIIISGIQFLQNLQIEQARLMVTEDHARRIIDRLTAMVDYYPEKQNIKEEKILPNIQKEVVPGKKSVKAKTKKQASK